MADPALLQLTIDEFFDWCPKDDSRWELVDGRPVAMAPANGAHQILSVALGRRFSEALDDRPPCTARNEAGIVSPLRPNTYYVADLAVTCRPHTFGERGEVIDPVVIVEILSSSTQGHNRKNKIPDYRGIPTVQEIVVVDQERIYGEVHRRCEGDRWVVDLLREPADRMRLESIGLDIPLGLLYVGVALEDGAEPEHG